MENNLGEWIKEGLSEINKNQVWLAGRVGVQPPQISRIISGESDATPDVLNRIADALRRPRIQAYRAAGHFGPPSDDPWVETMAHKISMIPPELREVAGPMLDAIISGLAETESKPRADSIKPGPKAKTSNA